MTKRASQATRRSDVLNRKPVSNRRALRNPACLDALRRQLEQAAEPVARQADAGGTLIEQVRAAWEEVLGIAPVGDEKLREHEREDKAAHIGGEECPPDKPAAAMGHTDVRLQTGALK